MNKQRKHLASNSYGSNAFYRYMLKHNFFNGTRFSQKELYSIVTTFNSLISDYIIRGHDFKIPYLLGTIGLRKVYRKPRIVDGKIIIHSPIDWKATNDYNSSQGLEDGKKIIVRRPSGDYFRIAYIKNKAIYNNKSFVRFKTCRKLKIKIKDNILNIDAFNLY